MPANHPSAELYHAHHAQHLEDLPFWCELAAIYNSPILELGCGTGRVLLQLARDGHRIYGLDKDPTMLAHLRRQIDPVIGPRISLLQADLTRFRLELSFGLIILPCNTYSTLNSVQRSELLDCADRHLRSDGVFAFSIPNPDYLRALRSYGEPEVEESFPHPVDGEPVQVSSGWRRRKDIFTVQWRYDHLQPDGRVTRTEVQTSHYLQPTMRYIEEIEEAGFTIHEMWGDFLGAPYAKSSPALIVIARKSSF